jgi:RNA polymerase sigma-70 factor (ECF subfamily)
MIAAAKINYLQERLARHDDQSAYKELYIAFYKPLLQFATSFVRSQQVAEEIVSDVFIHIWEKRKRIDSINNLRIYLYVAIRNTSLNYLSRKSKILTTNLDELALDPPGIYFDPEQLLVTNEMIELIRSAINQLPPKCRMIFKLVKEDELKYKEVADILNISVKTVEAQMTIALRKLGNAIRFDMGKSISSSPGPNQ